MRDKTALDSGSRQGSNEVALRQRQRERERERERESEREGIARRARSRAKRMRRALHVLLCSWCARDSIADYFAISDKSRSYSRTRSSVARRPPCTSGDPKINICTIQVVQEDYTLYKRRS